ncbi:MAG: FAD-dependent oxidoreductase [Treponema sp.]|nr:FAD-dependent oxidoreductase [Treponema sp.]
MNDINVDLLIIGAGPAGLTAAQYGARAGLNVLVVEQLAPGGQVLSIDVLENYPGNVEQLDAQGSVTSGPRTGYDFSQDLHRQAESFGASFLSGAVGSLKKEGVYFFAGLEDGKIIKAPAVIAATGAVHSYLNIPGEKEFFGRGVSYCATCDGPFFKNKKIFVIGGGDAACDEARYLSRLTDKVVLVHRRDRFRAQKAIADRVLDNPHIEVRFNTILKEIKGTAPDDKNPLSAGKVGALVLEHVPDSKVYEEAADAVFILAGMVPQSALVSGSGLGAKLDGNSYIITDQKMATAEPGLFAAGDVRSGSFRQVVVAAGEGATAAHNAAEYIDKLGGDS